MPTLARLRRHVVGDHARLGTHVVDLRDTPPDMFTDVSATDWSRLTWKDVKRPYTVEKWARAKRDWEREHGDTMPVLEGWKRFNRSFHELFATDVPVAQRRARDELRCAIARFDAAGGGEAIEELLHLAIWNKIHRVEDAVWDPRGKRALFEGLDVERPRILLPRRRRGLRGHAALGHVSRRAHRARGLRRVLQDRAVRPLPRGRTRSSAATRPAGTRACGTARR
jgi:hypothetical protein